jgi:hypothetical protein
MTEEYAKISLRAGYLAAAIEAVTGEPVIHWVRTRAWQFTPEFLEDFKVFALKAGVPQAALDQAEREAADYITNHPEMLRELIAAQDRVDRARRQ